MSKYKIREKVFVIGDRRVAKKTICAILETVNSWSRGSEFRYGLTRTLFGAGGLSNQPEFFNEEDVFSSEEEAKAAFFNTEVSE